MRNSGKDCVGESQLAERWHDAFNTHQPGIKIEYNLATAAIAVPALYFDLADMGINHEPSFYDYLAHLRLKGYEPTGIEAFTGAYDVVGWQNQLVIIVNQKNPITKVTMKQLDGIFGSAHDGSWVGTTWKPELRRGPEGDLRTWGQ